MFATIKTSKYLVLPLIMVFGLTCSLLAQEHDCAISGRVLDKKGKPMKGARIEINCYEYDFEQVVVTDKDGAYSLEKLKPGFYALRLIKKKWQGRNKTRRLEKGDKITVDFAPLRNAAAVCGEVLDLKGKPVPECRVMIANTRYCNQDGTEHLHEQTSTDEEGFFTFDNLHPGTYEFTIWKTGEICSSPGGEVRLKKGIEGEVTIKMHPGVLEGQVNVEGGIPEGIKWISIYIRKKGDFGGPHWNSHADLQDGTFEINNLPGGSFEAKALLTGYYCEQVFFKIPKKGKSKEIEIPLFVAGSILFKVTDDAGNPVEGIDVTEMVQLASGRSGGSSVHTDALGSGEYRVYASPGRHEYVLSSSIKGRVTKKVTVKAKEETVVEVKI